MVRRNVSVSTFSERFIWQMNTVSRLSAFAKMTTGLQTVRLLAIFFFRNPTY